MDLETGGLVWIIINWGDLKSEPKIYGDHIIKVGEANNKYEYIYIDKRIIRIFRYCIIIKKKKYYLKRVRRPEGCNFLVLFAFFLYVLCILRCNLFEQDDWVKKDKRMETPPPFWKTHAPSQIWNEKNYTLQVALEALLWHMTHAS